MIRRLDYDVELSFKEAEEVYEEMEKEFRRVKSNYSGIFSRFKSSMDKEDQKRLADCLEVIITLSVEPSVQDQVRTITDTDKSLQYKAQQLSRKIFEYLASFDNTGVKVSK